MYAQADPDVGGSPVPGVGQGRERRRSDDSQRAGLAGRALVAFDESLRIVAWDKMAEQLTGMPSHEAIGRHFGDVLGSAEARRPHGRGPDGPDLTPRQREVLELVGEGLPAKVIAARLGLAPTTVRNHIRALLQHLDAHSQLQAVANARRLGLL